MIYNKFIFGKSAEADYWLPGAGSGNEKRLHINMSNLLG